MNLKPFYIIKSKHRSEKGIAIIYSLLLVGVALSIVFVLSYIFAGKAKLLGESSDSVKAVFAADSGIESCLYDVRKGGVGAPTSCSGATPSSVSLSNGSAFTIIPLSTTSIRSIGSINGVNRALEVENAF